MQHFFQQVSDGSFFFHSIALSIKMDVGCDLSVLSITLLIVMHVWAVAHTMFTCSFDNFSMTVKCLPFLKTLTSWVTLKQ